MAYTTLAKVKALVDKSTDTDIDAKINNAIPWVDALIERETGRFFSERDYTAADQKTQADEDGQQFLILKDPTDARPLFPIISITLLKEGSTTLVSGEDYYLKSLAGGIIEKAVGHWTTEFEDIIFRGKFGYAAVPADIEAIATEMVTIIVAEKVKVVDTPDGGQTILMSAFPDYVKKGLQARKWRAI